MKLEKMNDFFAARIDGYDEHMLKNVEGCAALIRSFQGICQKTASHC